MTGKTFEINHACNVTFEFINVIIIYMCVYNLIFIISSLRRKKIRYILISFVKKRLRIIC